MARLTILLFLTLFGCGSPRTPTDLSANPAWRTGEVERALRAFSLALATPDTAQLRKMAMPRFALLKGGSVYDIRATQDSVQRVLASRRMTRTLEDFHTEVRGPTTWSRYQVRVDIQTGSQTKKISFHEAAVLEHNGQRWRLALMTTMSGPATH